MTGEVADATGGAVPGAHTITLSVGDVASTIEVQAQAVHVATDSSDRAIAIGLRQIEDTPTRGRNPLSLHAAERAGRVTGSEDADYLQLELRHPA